MKRLAHQQPNATSHSTKIQIKQHRLLLHSYAHHTKVCSSQLYHQDTPQAPHTNIHTRPPAHCLHKGAKKHPSRLINVCCPSALLAWIHTHTHMSCNGHTEQTRANGNNAPQRGVTVLPGGVEHQPEGFLGRRDVHNRPCKVSHAHLPGQGHKSNLKKVACEYVCVYVCVYERGGGGGGLSRACH